MITTTADIRARANVELSVADAILDGTAKRKEAFVADYFGDLYLLWDADLQEQTYAKERGAVREIVAGLVAGEMLKKFGYVITAFGVVVKTDEFSARVGEAERWQHAMGHEAHASAVMRQLSSDSGLKFDYAKDFEVKKYV